MSGVTRSFDNDPLEIVVESGHLTMTRDCSRKEQRATRIIRFKSCFVSYQDFAIQVYMPLGERLNLWEKNKSGRKEKQTTCPRKIETTPCRMMIIFGKQHAKMSLQGKICATQAQQKSQKKPCFFCFRPRVYLSLNRDFKIEIVMTTPSKGLAL
eukprot:g1027.t1